MVVLGGCAITAMPKQLAGVDSIKEYGTRINQLAKAKPRRKRIKDFSFTVLDKKLVVGWILYGILYVG